MTVVPGSSRCVRAVIVSLAAGAPYACTAGSSGLEGLLPDAAGIADAGDAAEPAKDSGIEPSPAVCEAHLSITPSKIVLGAEEPRRWVRRAVEATLDNLGTGECRIVETSWAPIGRPVERSDAELVIAPGASERWVLTLEFPPQSMPPTGVSVFTVRLDDGTVLRAETSLEVSPRSGPVLLVVPSALDFGAVPIGCEERRTLLVYNTGRASTTVTLVVPVPDPAFRVVAPPIELEPGTAAELIVIAAPVAEGLAAQQIVFESALDPATASSTVLGTPPSICE